MAQQGGKTGAFGPHVIVIGNHKGGCGKSTVSTHVIVALLQEGKRVAALDLDVEQQTLTRYLENRHAWGHEHGVKLALPDVMPSNTITGEGFGQNPAADATEFAIILCKLRERYDFVVIDTPSGGAYLSLLAHSMADTLLTPINDSFVDLDLIGTIGPATEFAPRRTRYRETVSNAAALRSSICGLATDWVIVRNRLSATSTRNERQVSELLHTMAPAIGFRLASGLVERVIYREFFPVGLTAFDPLDEAVLGLKPTMSHLMARREVRGMVTEIGLLPNPAAAEDVEDSLTRIVSDLRMPPAPQLAVDAPQLAVNDNDRIAPGILTEGNG
jgi:chromosome partitioning protein